MDNKAVTIERNVYTFNDFLGDLGGLKEMIYIFFGYFMFPLSELSFLLKATNRLFTAKTKRTDLFV